MSDEYDPGELPMPKGGVVRVEVLVFEDGTAVVSAFGATNQEAAAALDVGVTAVSKAMVAEAGAVVAAWGVVPEA
jgi:hypothetical protein